MSYPPHPEQHCYHWVRGVGGTKLGVCCFCGFTLIEDFTVQESAHGDHLKRTLGASSEQGEGADQ